MFLLSVSFWRLAHDNELWYGMEDADNIGHLLPAGNNVGTDRFMIIVVECLFDILF